MIRTFGRPIWNATIYNGKFYSSCSKKSSIFRKMSTKKCPPKKPTECPPCPPCPPCPNPCTKADLSPIPPNPCVPVYIKGNHKKYRKFFIYFALPLIVVQFIRLVGTDPPEKVPCHDYEYMRRRTKRFPWGDGNESFFHNEHVNNLPGECTKDINVYKK